MGKEIGRRSDIPPQAGRFAARNGLWASSRRPALPGDLGAPGKSGGERRESLPMLFLPPILRLDIRTYLIYIWVSLKKREIRERRDKKPPGGTGMTNMRTYEEERKDFNWGISEKELGYKPGDDINIAYY
jgi:hypothetical protein